MAKMIATVTYEGNIVHVFDDWDYAGPPIEANIIAFYDHDYDLVWLLCDETLLGYNGRLNLLLAHEAAHAILRRNGIDHTEDDANYFAPDIANNGTFTYHVNFHFDVGNRHDYTYADACHLDDGVTVNVD